MGKYNTLGSRIKGLRQSLGFSQADLAKQLNCSQAALSQYECGNREPGLNDLISIAERLNTTTDYLLGLTHISSKNADVKQIGDYLGLTEASITKLHSLYWKRKSKTSEDQIQEELQFYTGVSPIDDTYELDYEYIRRRSALDVEDYTRIINSFICAAEFDIFISCLEKNLYLERTIYDLLRIVTKEYEEIETPRFAANFAELAYGIVEDAEDNIRRYSLNLFDMQTALIDFCKSFTQLEEIKKLEYSESFYRKISFFIYDFTRPMFENDNYSITVMEDGVAETLAPLFPKIRELLRNKE